MPVPSCSLTPRVSGALPHPHTARRNGCCIVEGKVLFDPAPRLAPPPAQMYASAPLKPEEVKWVPRPDVMPTRGF